MSTTNRLFLAKLKKKSFSQHAQIDKFIESLHEFNLHEKERVGKMCKPRIRKRFMITHQLPFRRTLKCAHCIQPLVSSNEEFLIA
jgi:hypothetical protein